MTMIRLCLPYVWMLLTVRSRLVSSPSVLGLYPHSVFEISKRVILSDKVSSISIAETNPDYDVDNRTSKLAANLIHHF